MQMGWRLDIYFFDEDSFGGTLAPARRACESPMAMACFRLLTFLPDLPLFRVPFLRSCMAFSTFSDAFLPYLAIYASSRAVFPFELALLANAYSFRKKSPASLMKVWGTNFER